MSWAHAISSIRAIALSLLIISCPAAGLGQSRPTELKWEELTRIITGQNIQLALPDGTIVKGEAVAVRDDALVVDVRETTNPAAYPKGNAVLAKSSVTLIQVNGKRGSWGRNLGTVIGVVSGMALGAYATLEGNHSAGSGLATFAGITSVGAVGGYFAGKQLDKRVTYIKVIP